MTLKEDRAGEIFFITLKALHRKYDRRECSKECPFLHHRIRRAQVDDMYECRLFGDLKEAWMSYGVNSEHRIPRHKNCLLSGIEKRTDDE